MSLGYERPRDIRSFGEARPAWATTQLNYVTRPERDFILKNPLDDAGFARVLARIIKNAGCFERGAAAVIGLRRWLASLPDSVPRWREMLRDAEDVAYHLEKQLHRGCLPMRTFVYGDVHILTFEAGWRIDRIEFPGIEKSVGRSMPPGFEFLDK